MILLRIEMLSLFKVTAWEKASLTRRLLFAFGRVTLLFAVLLLIAYVIFAHRYAIEAKVWHWRHGYSTTIDGYEIPVPAHWLVLTQEHEYLTMVNISPNLPRDDSKIHTAPLVTVSVGLVSLARASGNNDWMSRWASRQRKRLADNKVESVVDKTLNSRTNRLAVLVETSWMYYCETGPTCLERGRSHLIACLPVALM